MDLTVNDLRRHALSFDLYFSRLEIIIEGLNNAVKHLYESELSIDWWGSMDEKHELGTIYKLAIIAYENYIISSVRYFLEEGENPQQFYNISPDIILVLSLAEYMKSHSKNNQEIFKKYSLYEDNYPIYHGIKILNKIKI
ncbi:hypothetical protein ASG31_14345 [Chryseobacterium sp. Leaf404]|uniref:hypothetical protein n=1 Tax=unclassified Chryseobacterium TaxID=2593645 RepID=UPI0006FCF291|nr:MULTISPECIES: hypothetical protein [unclassified Chryseobacterium]KQT16145.1 hypothetical protein ASG31_14345 [Chryseobacterium sp. Leaf404]